MTSLRRNSRRWLPAAVAVLGAGSSAAGSAAGSAAPAKGATSTATLHFVSAPDLKPPKVSADRKTMYRSIRPGYFLLTTDGAEILDTHLHPVWFRPGLIQDLKQQSYEGKPVLTWWQGTLTSNGAGDGSIYVADEHYRVVATLNPATGWSIDSHEAVIHGHDIWVTSIRTLTKGRFGRSSRAKRRPLLDDAVQEYDLRNGRLLRSWDVFNPGRKPHVPLSESDLRQPDVPDEQNFPWDPYHVNSIQPVGAHELLVSMRNTSAVYLINVRTGKVVWTLGGEHSSFKIPRIARFHFQHDVVLHPDGIVTLFDDRCCDQQAAQHPGVPYGPSRGLVLKLDPRTHRVSFVRQYLHEPPLEAAVWGSMQMLPNGDGLVGWGSAPYFSEYSASGKRLLDASISQDASYRVLFTSNWVGTPFYPPSVVMTTDGQTRTIHATWNGATRVAAWEVLAGASRTHLKLIARRSRTGFETALRIPNESFATLRVEALDASGHPIGSRTLTGS